MSIFRQFETDQTKEQEGVEVQYAPNADGTVPTFRIRRRGPSNPRYVKALERESAPYRRLLDAGILDPKIQERILVRVFCDSVLISWSHVQTKEGQDIAFNMDNAMSLFNQLPELYYDLAEQSGKLSSFRVDSQEADAKN